MPRRTRIHLPGLPLHIVQRGHNRDACFFAEEDYLTYLHWLGEALRESGCALHAYVLMTNHVHLLVTPTNAMKVPKLIISMGRRYVQYINTTYRRTGTLWDSRYKSSLIQAETYLLACMRYIELNPVRAAMVDVNREFVVAHGKSYGQMLKHVLDAGGPVLIHCAAGKDRTGFGAAIILSVLGVDEETIMADYLLSGHFLDIDRTVDKLLKR